MEVYHQAGGGPATSESEQAQRKLTFLRHVIPFDSLRHEELERLASSMAWREFQPGSIIIKQGVRGTHFYIVQTGLAKVYLHEEGKETVLGFLGEADCFGEMALVNRELTAANVEAIEDTLCLEQTEEAFLRMVQTYPVFFRFFSQLLTRRMKSVYKECLCENTGVRRIEPFLFRKQVTEMLSAEAPFCEENTTIREVAARLLESSTGSLIVEKNGQHKNQLNIKTFGLLPLVTCVKLLAWRDGIPETNTLTRISALAAKDLFSADSAEFLEQAFESFLTLKIRNDLSDWEQGREPNNYLDPGLLSTRQKQLLKEAFLAVSELQKITKETMNIIDQRLLQS